MTDTTAARRALLSLLLDRVERGALLPAEAPLLRPLVAADQADADAEQHLIDGMRQNNLDAACVAMERAEQAEAAVARVRELAERWRYVPGLKDSPRTSVLRALDGPSPTPDDTPPTTSGPLGLRVVQRGEAGWVWECHHCGAWSGEHYTSEDIAREYARTKHLAHIGEADDDTPTTRDDQATADRAALDAVIAELPQQALDLSVEGNGTGQRLGVLGALRAGQPVTVGRLEELADAGISVCSPLVNASCPGHTGPPYCDRAPSSPATMTAAPDWQALAEQQPMQLVQPIPTADAPTTAPDDDPADGSSGTPILDEMLASYRAQHPADDAPTAACRVMPTRTCPEYAEPCGDRCARFESDDPTPWMPEQQADATVTDWATSVDEQCPAHYTGEPPQLSQPVWPPVDYRCERRGHGLDSDHAVRQGGDLVFCWTDAIAVYPTSDTTTMGDDTPSGSRRTGTDPDD